MGLAEAWPCIHWAWRCGDPIFLCHPGGRRRFSLQPTKIDVAEPQYRPKVSPVQLSLEYELRVTWKQAHYFVVTSITAVMAERRMLFHMGHYCMVLVTRSTRLNVTKCKGMCSVHWAWLIQQFDGQGIEQCKFSKKNKNFLLGQHRWSHREPIIGGVLNISALSYLQRAQVVSWCVRL